MGNTLNIARGKSRVGELRQDPIPTMVKIVVLQLLNLNIMPQTKESKQKQAKILLEQRAQRTPQQQIELLDQKFGVGVGAKKERARLTKML